MTEVYKRSLAVKKCKQLNLMVAIPDHFITESTFLLKSLGNESVCYLIHPDYTQMALGLAR